MDKVSRNKYMAVWRDKNREKLQAYQLHWKIKNDSPYRQEKARQRAKDWYYKHKERVAARQSARKQESQSLASQRKDYWRAKALEKLGDKCIRCGFSDPRALQFDHIYGDGAQDRKAKNTRSQVGFYKAIAIADEYKNLIQILCCNCNWIKRAEQLEHK